MTLLCWNVCLISFAVKAIEILGTAIVMLDGIGMRVTRQLTVRCTAKVNGAINCGLLHDL